MIRKPLVAIAVALMAAVAPSTVAEAEVPNYYSVPFDPVILYHRADSLNIVELNEIDWLYSGQPTPTPAPTSIVQLPGSPELYAVSVLGDAAYWDALDYDQWRGAGFPAPTTGRDIAGTFDVHRYVSSPEVFLSLFPLGVRKLSHEVWSGLGSPAPTVDPVVVAALTWAPEGIGEIFPTGPAESSTWSLSYSEWSARGFPTPVLLPSLPNDVVCKVQGSSTLRYVGRTYNGVLTYEQWAATHFLPPLACG